MFPFLAKVELPDISKTQDLGQFIGDVYTFAITIVGVLVFVVFLWAGWLYLTAAGNAGNVGKAKTMMTNAVVGAIILLSAYLVLYVINPDLVENTFDFKLPATGPATGLNYSPSDKLKLIDLAPNAGKAKDPVTVIFQSQLTGIKVLWDGAEIGSVGEVNPGEIIFIIPDNAVAGDHKVALKAGSDVSNELVFKVGAIPAAGGAGSGSGAGGGGGGSAPPAGGGGGGAGAGVSSQEDGYCLSGSACIPSSDGSCPGTFRCSCESGTLETGDGSVDLDITSGGGQGSNECRFKVTNDVCRATGDC